MIPFPFSISRQKQHVFPKPFRSKSEHVRLKIGVMYCDEYKATHLQIVNGIWDYLEQHAIGSTLHMFSEGPLGLMRPNDMDYKEIDTSAIPFITPHPHFPYGVTMVGRRGSFKTLKQYQRAEKTVIDLELDGLVLIGGDDATINAHLLDNYFRCNGVKTCVIACPNTIQGDSIDTDQNCNELPSWCGFDNVCKAYCRMIKKIKGDAQSRGDCYHFVRVTGHASSSIVLKCAMLTYPTIALIGDEVSSMKLTLKDVRDRIVDVICARSKLGYNHGVILIPEDLLYFIPEVRQLFTELNTVSLDEDKNDDRDVMKSLTEQSAELLKDLRQLNLNVNFLQQIPEIDTVSTLVQTVETELEKRKKKGLYMGDFKCLSHYVGYMKQDIVYEYCYEVGYAAGELIHSRNTGEVIQSENTRLMSSVSSLIQSGNTGLMSSVGSFIQFGITGLMPSVQNLAEPVDKWIISWIPLKSLVELRDDEYVVIKKRSVKLNGFTFRVFVDSRDQWTVEQSGLRVDVSEIDALIDLSTG